MDDCDKLDIALAALKTIIRITRCLNSYDIAKSTVQRIEETESIEGVDNADDW